MSKKWMSFSQGSLVAYRTSLKMNKPLPIPTNDYDSLHSSETATVRKASYSIASILVLNHFYCLQSCFVRDLFHTFPIQLKDCGLRAPLVWTISDTPWLSKEKVVSRCLIGLSDHPLFPLQLLCSLALLHSSLHLSQLCCCHRFRNLLSPSQTSHSLLNQYYVSHRKRLPVNPPKPLPASCLVIVHPLQPSPFCNFTIHCTTFIIL